MTKTRLRDSKKEAQALRAEKQNIETRLADLPYEMKDGVIARRSKERIVEINNRLTSLNVK